jgi:hypothetical protein
MLFTRPRQPAAGRRPPHGPEHAETGRPLPRVTATDDSVPEPLRFLPADIGRPGFPPTVLFRPPTDFDARRFSPRPTADCPCAARGPSREAQTCAATPARPGSVPEANNRSYRYPRRDAPVPGSPTGPALASGARTAARRNARGDRSTVRPLPARDAGRRRLARGTACWWTELVVRHPSRRRAGASRKPPEGARPSQGTRCRPAVGISPGAGAPTRTCARC